MRSDGSPAVRIRSRISRLATAVFFTCAAGLVSPGCVTVTIPTDEYNLARAAIESAKESESPRFAPGLWYKAEQAYKEGQRLYKDRRYSQAQKLFVEAKFLAEKAENAARVARFQSGENVP